MKLNNVKHMLLVNNCYFNIDLKIDLMSLNLRQYNIECHFLSNSNVIFKYYRLNDYFSNKFRTQ